MDSTARTFTHELLRRKRSGRIMVLTTHFMDEADTLGDRICIMGEGKVRTCGSSLFLKRKFGTGYNLTITKTTDCDTKKLIKNVKDTVNDSSVLTDVGAEISFQLPTEEAQSFPKLLTGFEKEKTKWGIRDYGISITTLEEIFIRVARGKDMHRRKSAIAMAEADMAKDDSNRRSSKDWSSNGFQQAYAIFLKRYRFGKRDNRAMACTLAMPMLLVFVGIAILKWGSSISSGPEYTLDVDKFLQPNVPIPYASADSAATGDATTLMSYASSDVSPVLVTLDPPSGVHEIWGQYYINGTCCLDGTQDCTMPWFPSPMWPLGPKIDRDSNNRLYPAFDEPILASRRNSAPEILDFGKKMEAGWSSADAYWGAPLFTELDTASSRFEYVLFNNESASHASGIFMNIVNDALANMLSGNTIKTSVWPFPITKSQEAFNDQTSAIFLVMFLTLGVAFLPAGCAEFIVREREATRNAKHLQMLSGCGIVPYWFGNFLWDYIMMLPFAAFTIVMIFAFDVKGFHENGVYQIVIAALVFFGFASVAFTYLATFMFKNSGNAQLWIVFMGFLIGFVLVLVAFIMSIVESMSCTDETWYSYEGVDCNAWASVVELDVNTNPACVNLTPLISSPSLIAMLAALGSDTDSVTDATCADAATVLPTAFYNVLRNNQGNSPQICAQGAVALNFPDWQFQEITRFCELSCGSCTPPTLNKMLKNIYRIFPPFCLGDCFYTVLWKSIMFELNALEGVTTEEQLLDHLWEWDNCGGNIYMLMITAAVYFVFVCLCDAIGSMSFCGGCCGGSKDFDQDPTELDEDVASEREAMLNRPDDVVRVLGLKKAYGNHHAVRNLQFGIPKGGCFGLLGINGAGKTSTLKCMTGDVKPTHGTATLAGFDVVRQMLKVRQVVGYCPQFDGLNDLLTVREHLELYARLKGVPSSDRMKAIDSKIKQFDLMSFTNKRAGTLSGGNKRKLSMAIAVLGNPPVLFLDEPSSGMDPVARRFMWKVIADISTRSGDCTVILTTHAMEECEALCDNVAIMVAGQFKCLGSIQHLKGRFGQGFTVEVRVNAADESADSPAGVDVTSVLNCFRENFAGFEIIEQNADNVVIRIPQENQSVADIFTVMEDKRESLNIKEYSVQQTTLEQIFNMFAKADARGDSTSGYGDMIITVPKGVKPGQTLEITALDGSLRYVVVPKGKKPGDNFRMAQKDMPTAGTNIPLV